MSIEPITRDTPRPLPYDDMFRPWVVLNKHGDICWLGMATSEADAWSIALGWPDKDEIDYAKRHGARACQIEKLVLKGE